MSMAPLSALDAAFLAAETPSQHLHVLATLVLDTADEELPFAAFQRRVAERFFLIEPLRRRLQPVPFGDPVWVDDASMHLSSHLHHVHVDGGGLAALAAVAGDIASKQLPRDRPLWEAWLVDGFETDRVAVIAKVHHCAVDGVSGFEALAAFFDIEPHPETPLWTGTWDPAPLPTAIDIVREAVRSQLSMPGRVARGARHLVSSAVAATRVPRDDAALPLSAPRLSFNRALTPSRGVAFTDIGLDEVKAIRHAFGATVNDVVTALTAGVLRRHLLAHDEVLDRALVAAVPTSERLPEHGQAGNRISAMFYGLPVHLDDPAERLAAVQRAASAAKDLHAAAGVGTVAAVAAMLPSRAVGPIMRAVSGLRLADRVPPFANVIVSNIRGPAFPLYVAGARVEEIFPMGPLMEGTGLGVTVVTYRDRVGIGFLACPDLLPDLDDLAAAVPIEVAALVDAASRA